MNVMNAQDFPSIGFSAGTAARMEKRTQASLPTASTTGKGKVVSMQEFLRPVAAGRSAAAVAPSPFADDAVADASICWIPAGVVRAESWQVNKESDVLTTVFTCCGRSCRASKRWLQFGRAAECLEHLAECEGFRFQPCPVVECGEWVWDARMREHCTHAHPVAQGTRKQQRSSQPPQQRAKGHTKKATAKAARLAEAAAAPGGIVVRTASRLVGWTKAHAGAAVPASLASDSGLSSDGSRAGSPAVARRSGGQRVTDTRKKVLAWDKGTAAARAAPLMAKNHYCLHDDCMTSTRGFNSEAAVEEHAAAAHKA